MGILSRGGGFSSRCAKGIEKTSIDDCVIMLLNLLNVLFFFISAKTAGNNVYAVEPNELYCISDCSVFSYLYFGLRFPMCMCVSMHIGVELLPYYVLLL